VASSLNIVIFSLADSLLAISQWNFQTFKDSHFALSTFAMARRSLDNHTISRKLRKPDHHPEILREICLHSSSKET